MTALAAELAKTFLGPIAHPEAPGYDEIRKVHNGMIDKRPALIARCRGLADIGDAVRFARAQKLEIAVRGGGHNIGGRGTVDRGLMIDLSLMKGIYVNAASRQAVVEGGVLWKELNRETQLHGLAVTGGVIGTTGVAGLTLGGGLGWLMPKYGMALDNLVAVNLVLADGSVVRASADDHPDLFWAVRGGGGNFGVAGSFEFRLHPVGPTVIGGLVAFPFAEAGKVLRAFREMSANPPDDLMIVAGLLTAPDGSGNKLAAVVACHTGSPEDGQAAMARLRTFGTVAMDALGPIPYAALNGMLDANYPAGVFNYWKAEFMPRLEDGAIDALVAAFDKCPNQTSHILVENFHGAASRVPVDATAFALRETGFNTLMLGQWMDPAQGKATIDWCRQAFGAIRSYAGQKRYLNYLSPEDEGEGVAAVAYGPNLPRLRQIKKKYDPDNVFHINVNITPA